MSRPSLKESVGTSVNASNLAANSERQRPVDRLGAMARADELGAALWRLKVGGDMRVLHRAAVLLAQRGLEQPWATGWKLKPKPGRNALLLRMAQALINEWLQDQCPKCKGRKRTGMGRGAVVVNAEPCAECHGSGRVLHMGKLSRNLVQKNLVGFMAKPLIEGNLWPCQACGGRGKRVREKSVKGASLGKPCTRCEGTGKRRMVGAERARVVGVSTQAYFPHWHPRFEALRKILLGAYRAPHDLIRQQLTEDEGLDED